MKVKEIFFCTVFAFLAFIKSNNRKNSIMPQRDVQGKELFQ